jgi:hypothetical protein
VQAILVNVPLKIGKNQSKDRCYDFLPKILAKILAFFLKLLLVFAKI